MCFITMDLEPDDVSELTDDFGGNPLSTIDDIDSFVESSFEGITTNLPNVEKQSVSQALPLANHWIH